MAGLPTCNKPGSWSGCKITSKINLAYSIYVALIIDAIMTIYILLKEINNGKCL